MRIGQQKSKSFVKDFVVHVLIFVQAPGDEIARWKPNIKLCQEIPNAGRRTEELLLGVRPDQFKWPRGDGTCSRLMILGDNLNVCQTLNYLFKVGARTDVSLTFVEAIHAAWRKDLVQAFMPGEIFSF